MFSLLKRKHQYAWRAQNLHRLNVASAVASVANMPALINLSMLNTFGTKSWCCLEFKISTSTLWALLIESVSKAAGLIVVLLQSNQCRWLAAYARRTKDAASAARPCMHWYSNGQSTNASARQSTKHSFHSALEMFYKYVSFFFMVLLFLNVFMFSKFESCRV